MTKLQHVIKICRIFFFLLWLISFALFSAFFFLFFFWLFKHFYGGPFCTKCTAQCVFDLNKDCSTVFYLEWFFLCQILLLINGLFFGKEKNKLPALCPLLEGFICCCFLSNNWHDIFIWFILQKVNHIFIIFNIKLYKEWKNKTFKSLQSFMQPILCPFTAHQAQ